MSTAAVHAYNRKLNLMFNLTHARMNTLQLRNWTFYFKGKSSAINKIADLL